MASGVDMQALSSALAQNVLIVRFDPRGGSRGWRRMLCTNNMEFLHSTVGTVTLKYNYSFGVGLKYNPWEHGLVVAWDILYQNWRQIPIESARVEHAVSLNPDDGYEEFLKYYYRMLDNMDSWDKMRFMGK